jgi:hypothetical protein
VTTYLLEIMALGTALFVFAALWEKRLAERPESLDPLTHPANLDAIERDLLVRLARTVIRSKADFSADVQAEEAPRKASAK